MLEDLIERRFAGTRRQGMAVRHCLAAGLAVNERPAPLAPRDMAFLCQHVERAPHRATSDAELARQRPLGRNAVAETHGVVGDELLEPGQRLIEGQHGSQYVTSPAVLQSCPEPLAVTG